MTRTHTEIERTFLLSAMPDLPSHAIPLRIEQGYLIADGAPAPDAPGGGDGAHREGRLRRTTLPDGTVECRFTVKRGTGLVRQETEREISEGEFLERWPQTAGARLRKTRHRVAEQELWWEVDEFDELDLVLAEIELPAADLQPALPSWLAPLVVREVTEEPAYRNFEIARRMVLEGRGGD